MIYLIDTHVLVWLSMNTTRLTPKTKGILEDPDNEIYFSAISIFEIAVKQQWAKKDFHVEASAYAGQ